MSVDLRPVVSLLLDTDFQLFILWPTSVAYLSRRS